MNKKLFMVFVAIYLVSIITALIALKQQKPPQDLELVSETPVYTITVIDTGETIYRHTAPIAIVEWDRKNKYLEFIDYDDRGRAQRVQWNEYCVVLVTSSTDAYIGGGR